MLDGGSLILKTNYTNVRSLALKIEWEPMTNEEYDRIFACSVSRRGNKPNLVLVERDNGKIIRYAVQYIEDGKWVRWGIRNEHGEIKESWSTIMEWLRPLIDDNPAIEVYPRVKDLVDSAPTRWFWVIPGDLPKEFNLND